MGNITKIFSWLKLALVILGGSQSIFAQDAQLSQFYNAALFYNPATTGQQIENIRLSYHHRQQWASVTDPYITNSFSLDKAVKGWGIGFTWINNHAGETSVHNNNILGSLAYNVKLDAFSNISAGIQFGIYQRSINTTQLTFDNQYSQNTGFDPLQPTGEDLLNARATSSDINIGLLWHTARQKFNLNLGVALSHLNRPNVSLYQNTENELEQKLVFHGNLVYKIKHDVHIIPTALWGVHGHAQQINLGLIAKYFVNDSISVEGGITSRINDAAIIYGGLGYKRFFLGLNYDVNYSSLRNASYGRGAFEFNLQIQFGKKPKKNKKSQLSTANKTGDNDLDKDGIPDSSDKCPTVYGFPEYLGCPLQDSDKDGITDDKDLCPLIYGLVENKGCPNQQDYDKDGIPDHIDKCPYAYGIQKYNGCPFRDTDNDGITDDVDQCPNVAGTAAFKGCPFKDTDNDGMTDDIDQCPNEPGDIRNMGCPIGDIDKDGIADHIDQCPKQAGSLKNNGCPEGYSALTKDGNHIFSGGNNIDLGNLNRIKDVIVYFDVDKSFIKSKYRKLLDEAASVLSKNSRYTILINGHTDHDGSDEYNFKLGERRATEVRNYLIHHSVPYDRMVTLSHGELLPADSNSHHLGKAKNRRVEVIVIKNE